MDPMLQDDPLATAFRSSTCLQCRAALTPLSFTFANAFLGYCVSGWCETCQSTLPVTADREPQGEAEPRVRVGDQILTLRQERYRTGMLALRFDQEDGDLWAYVTANLPEVVLPPFMLTLKTWDDDAAMALALVRDGVVAPTPAQWRIKTGYVYAPVVAFLRPITVPPVPLEEQAAARRDLGL